MPDKDVIKGKVKQAEGRMQNTWGDMTDDEDDQVEGEEKELAGKAQETWGHAKDAARKLIDKM